jgi:hypothetical protein
MPLYLFIFIQIGALNSSLINILEDHFKFLLVLPICISNIKIDIWNGIFIIYDFKILVPPLNEDNRWKKECIIHIESIILEFNFIQLIYGQIISNLSLIYVKNIYINSLTLTVEGYDDAATGQLLLNIGLIGGPSIEEVVEEEVIYEHIFPSNYQTTSSFTTPPPSPSLYTSTNSIQSTPNSNINSSKSKVQSYFTSSSKNKENTNNIINNNINNINNNNNINNIKKEINSNSKIKSNSSNNTINNTPLVSCNETPFLRMPLSIYLSIYIIYHN